MNIGVIIGIFIIVLSYISFGLWWYMTGIIERKCTRKTIGIIVDYSYPRGSENHPVFLPVAEYVVNDKKYRVAGPEFRNYSVVNTLSMKQGFERSVESNLTTRDKLPEDLYIKYVSNPIYSYSNDESPICKLYPLNTEVDVYYNPAKPKMAYVQRYVGKSYYYIWLVPVGFVLFFIGLVTIIHYLYYV